MPKLDPKQLDPAVAPFLPTLVAVAAYLPDWLLITLMGIASLAGAVVAVWAFFSPEYHQVFAIIGFASGAVITVVGAARRAKNPKLTSATLSGVTKTLLVLILIPFFTSCLPPAVWKSAAEEALHAGGKAAVTRGYVLAKEKLQELREAAKDVKARARLQAAAEALDLVKAYLNGDEAEQVGVAALAEAARLLGVELSE